MCHLISGKKIFSNAFNMEYKLKAYKVCFIRFVHSSFTFFVLQLFAFQTLTTLLNTGKIYGNRKRGNKIRKEFKNNARQSYCLPAGYSTISTNVTIPLGKLPRTSRTEPKYLKNVFPEVGPAGFLTRKLSSSLLGDLNCHMRYKKLV